MTLKESLSKSKQKITNIKNKVKEKVYLKKNILFVWVAFIIIVTILYFIFRNKFTLDILSIFIEDYKFLAVIIYILILCVIGLTFIPSAPFTLAGLLFFPPLETFLYNLFGIAVPLTIVYYLAQYVGLDDYLEHKYPQKIIKLRKILSRKVFFIIAIWSFTPFVPTDLIVYVSSSLKISYRKCLFGVLLGEGLLNLLYIFSLGYVLF